jgi:DNA (cytosine-5)-methyltransferase 1
MLIQSVPDGYALPKEMSLSKKFKTIANGVPVLVARAIAEQIAAVLFSETSLEVRQQ